MSSSSSKSQEVLLFPISFSSTLQEKLTRDYGCEFCELKSLTFPDGEHFIKLRVSVRGKKVFIFHSLSDPVNENLIKLLITIDACKRSSAKEINLIVSYLAYTRQDRKTEERSAITSRMVADLISNSGATRITTFDLHSDQIEGFFKIPVDHLYTIPFFAEHILRKYGETIKEFVVVAPDFGATKKARALADLLSIPIVIMEKIRGQSGAVDEHFVYGDVQGKRCLIFDDIIGTGGTVINASSKLLQLGAKEVVIGATHGLFSGSAHEKFRQAYDKGLFTKIFITDSVPTVSNFFFIEVISLAKAIFGVLDIYSKGEGSISKLYEGWNREIKELKSQFSLGN